MDGPYDYKPEFESYEKEKKRRKWERKMEKKGKLFGPGDTCNGLDRSK